jgi:GT2 family glycosyltransferase
LRLNGHRAMLIPTAVVYHLGGATSGGRQSDFAVYHGHRNLVWAYAKNMPGLRVWWYLPQHFFLNIFTVLYFVAQGRGSIILRAKWDALVGLRGALRKRRKIQRTSRVVPSQVCSLMSTNVFSPYRRNRAG